MTTTTLAEKADPRDTFLTTADVFARYGWGRSAGYERIKTPRFPTPLPGSRWRLDTLYAWEDAVMASALTADPPALQDADSDAQDTVPAPAGAPVRRRARKDAA